jgi:hypothetical protein
MKTERLRSLQGKMKILKGIARGERAVLEKQTCTQDQAKQKMKQWFNTLD